MKSVNMTSFSAGPVTHVALDRTNHLCHIFNPKQAGLFADWYGGGGGGD